MSRGRPDDARGPRPQDLPGRDGHRGKLRAPVDVTGKAPPTTSEFRNACGVVERSRVLERLSPAVDDRTGRPRTLPLKAFLVAAQVNALRPHHVAHLVEITRTLNSFSPSQRFELGMSGWDPRGSYVRVERLFVRIVNALEAEVDASDAPPDPGAGVHWFLNRFLDASCVDDLPRSSSLAIDGTDVPTWGRLHGDVDTVEVDSEEAPDERADDESRRKPTRPIRRKPKARVLGRTATGRLRYTADPDALAGWRSATNSRPAGPYIGRELHLGVQTRDVEWTDSVARTRLGERVPALIRLAALVPAGTHRGESVVPTLVKAKKEGKPIEDVAWDPGYSLGKPEKVAHPLRQAGIHQTFRPASHQWNPRPFSDHVLVIGGHLFSAYLPDELLNLRMPAKGATKEQKVKSEEAFNRRALHRYTLHAGPDGDGATRWMSPFHAGRLRSPGVPQSMRASRTKPLGSLPERIDLPATTTALPADLPHWQETVAGTTAHAISMGRRLVVEMVNGALKGGFTNTSEGFARVFTTPKVALLLSFTLAGYNLWAARSFRALTALIMRTELQRKRARRRRGTYHDIAWLQGENQSPHKSVRGPPPS